MNRNIDVQIAYEDSGAAAALQGKRREDCPYAEGGDADEKFRWNHWVFGFENAKGEMDILKRGSVSFTYAGADLKTSGDFTETAERAYRSGRWKPRHVKVPDEWNAPAGSNGETS